MRRSPPFSQKIFSENLKISKKNNNNVPRQISRLKSDFSNLVKSRIPDLRGGPSINPVHYTIYCLQRLLHVMHKVQLANGASMNTGLPTHPSRRPLLHSFPIIGFQSCRKAEFRDFDVPWVKNTMRGSLSRGITTCGANASWLTGTCMHQAGRSSITLALQPFCSRYLSFRHARRQNR